MHVVEELINQLKAADNDVEREPFILGDSFRHDNGELLAMDFTDTVEPLQSQNPYKGYRENKVHVDGVTSALFSSPGPCTGANAAPLAVIPQNLALGLPEIKWNYAPAFSTSTIPKILDASFFSSVCVYIQANLNGVDVNAQQVAGKLGTIIAKRKSLPLPNVSGITCDDCFAYVGASLQLAMTCSVGVINECHFGMQAGGGVAANMNLKIINPSLMADTGFLMLYNASSYSTLYKNPAMLLSIKAKPTLYLRLAGNLVASGQASLTANINTTAALTIVASSPSSIGSIDAGFAGHVSLTKPVFDSSLQIADSSLQVYITPLVVWQIELGKLVSVLGKQTGFALKFEVGTAFTAK